MNLYFPPYAVAYFISAAMAAVVMQIAWRRRTATGGRAMALLMLAVAEWSLAAALEAAADDISAKILWAKVEYLGIASSPTLYLLFALQYSQQDQWLTRRNRVLLWIMPVLTIFIAWTNDWHHLLWNSFTLNPNDHHLLIYGRGIWFWVAIAFGCLQVLIGAFTIANAILRFPHLYRRQALPLVVSSFVPLAGSLVYLSLNPIPGLDWAPITFALTGLILAWSIFRFQPLDLAPIARDVLIENLSDGVVVLDRQNRIVDINPAAQRILRQTRSIIGQPAKVVLSDWPDLARFRDMTEAHTEIVVGQDTRRVLDLRISPLLDRRAQLTGRLVVLRDITEEKQAQEKLRQLSRAVEQSPASVVITDTDGNIEYVNPKFTQLTGYSLEESLGQNPRILKSGETPPEGYKRMWDTIQSGGEWRGEFHNKKKNGELYWESAVISPITDAQGNITHFLAVKEDITGRKRIEQDEREQRALAEALRGIIGVLNSTLDLDQVLDRILTNIGRVVPHDAVNLMLIDPSTGLVEVALRWGYDERSQTQVLPTAGFSVMSVPNLIRMAETGRPTVVPDTRGSPYWVTLGELNWQRSYVGAPIHIKGQTVGFLNLDSATPGFFTESDAERLRAFADQAAIAIQNARLYAEAQQRAERMGLLNEMSIAINLSGELRAVLQAAVDGLARVLNVSQVGMALFDETRQHLAVMADHPAPGNASAVGVELPVEGNLSLQRVLSTQSPLAIEDAQHDPLTAHIREIMARQRVRSILIVPLVARNKVIGTLGCDVTESSRQFSPEEIELAQTVAALVTLRIEQARLFEAERIARQQAQQRALDLSGLYAIARGTSRSLALEDVLTQALSSALVSLGYEAGLIALAELGRSSSELRVVAERGLPAAMLKRLAQGSLAGTLIAHIYDQHEIILIDDLSQESSAALRAMVAKLEASDWQALVGIPLLQQEQSLGVMYLCSHHPRPTASQDLALLVGIGHQIATAVTNAQLFQATLNERSRLKALIESSRDGIILSALDGAISIINAPALQMLRLPGQPGDWLGTSLTAALSYLHDYASGFETVMTELERARTGDGPPAEGEAEVPPRVIRWQSLPVHVGTRPMGRLIVLRDMTEERAVERMREDMTHTMVHDLRNPLSSILMSVEFLIGGAMGELTSQQIDGLTITRRNTRRMMELVNSILDVSRLESGRMPIEPCALSVIDLIADAIRAQSALSSEKGIRLESSLPSALPFAWADASLIHRVMQNLIGNAVKFTPQGGLVSVAASLDKQAPQPMLLISVSDAGPGISPEIQGRLFQKFVTGREEGSGSGLGLAFCKLTIEAHGGRIWVDSILDHGTTFTFTLPVVSEAS